MIVVGEVGLGVAMLMLATSRYLAVSLVALLIAGAALLIRGVEQYAVANDRRRGQTRALISLFAVAASAWPRFAVARRQRRRRIGIR